MTRHLSIGGGVSWLGVVHKGPNRARQPTAFLHRIHLGYDKPQVWKRFSNESRDLLGIILRRQADGIFKKCVPIRNVGHIVQPLGYELTGNLHAVEDEKKGFHRCSSFVEGEASPGGVTSSSARISPPGGGIPLRSAIENSNRFRTNSSDCNLSGFVNTKKQPTAMATIIGIAANMISPY